MKNKLYIILLIIIHAMAFVWAVLYGNHFTKDSFEYLRQSKNIIEYHSLYCGDFTESIHPELYSQRPPGYALLLVLTSLFDGVIAILFIQTLLSLFNLFITLKIIRKFSGNIWLILPALIFFPSQIIYVNLVMSEILLQTTVILSAWLFILYIDSGKSNYLYGYIICLTAALLVKPVFIAFPVLSAIMILFISELRNRRNTLLKWHLIPVAMVLLVSLNNYLHTSCFEYSSIARKLMVNYQAFYSVSFNEGKSAAIATLDSLQYEADSAASYEERCRILRSGAGRMIGLNLDAYLFLTAKGMFNFFTDHSGYDIALINGSDSEAGEGALSLWRKEGVPGLLLWLNHQRLPFLLYSILSILFNTLLLIGMIRFAFLSKVPPYLRIFILSTIFYVAFLTGMSGTTRFRLPVFPLILIANAVFYRYYSYPWSKKEWAEVEE